MLRPLEDDATTRVARRIFITVFLVACLSEILRVPFLKKDGVEIFISALDWQETALAADKA